MSADVFLSVGAGFNVALVDGDGSALEGVGLVEPHHDVPGVPDDGDNLDALNMFTMTCDLRGRMYI